MIIIKMVEDIGTHSVCQLQAIGTQWHPVCLPHFENAVCVCSFFKLFVWHSWSNMTPKLSWQGRNCSEMFFCHSLILMLEKWKLGSIAAVKALFDMSSLQSISCSDPGCQIGTANSNFVTLHRLAVVYIPASVICPTVIEIPGLHNRIPWVFTGQNS